MEAPAKDSQSTMVYAKETTREKKENIHTKMKRNLFLNIQIRHYIVQMHFAFNVK